MEENRTEERGKRSGPEEERRKKAGAEEEHLSEDDEIIRMYHQRDERAIIRTERKHGFFCRGLASHFLPDREDVEECVNDTWLAAWNRMPPAWPDSLRAFLGRIVRNLSVSRFRKMRAAKRYAGMETLISELEECVPDNAVEKELERRILADILIRWLDGLEPDDRIAFVRRYWYGDTVKELAGEYGGTANRMTKRLQRLRGSLRRVLEREAFW